MAEPLRFKSAVGRSFLLVITVALLLGPVLVGVSVWQGKTPARELPEVLVFMLMPAVLIYALYRATEYRIEDENLVVRGGIVNATVPLAAIRTVRATNTWMSAPAMSFDRLEIVYDGYSSVVISPDDKPAFLAEIRRRCPRAIFEGLDDSRPRAG